jgi:hypothetical protein
MVRPRHLARASGAESRAGKSKLCHEKYSEVGLEHRSHQTGRPAADYILERLMVTTRTPRSVNKRARITPEIVALYRGVIELRDGSDAWEEGGGTRAACLDAEVALHDALGRKPWDYDVTDCVDPDPPPTVTDDWRINMWRETHEIYKQLEAALEQD